MLFGTDVPAPIAEDTLLTDDDLVRDVSERAKEYVTPNLTPYQVGAYWRSLQEQAKITSVISGKGGVGKTSLALGLTEYYSEFENVLAVDFDLHNRGLTSKYGQLTPDHSTVFSEMTRFRNLILSDERLPREAGKVVLSRVDSDLFHDLRSK